MSDESKDALTRFQGDNRHSHRRVQCGWPRDEGQEAVALTVGTDVHGDRYVTVQAQRRLKRGPDKGKWTAHGASGALHTRQDFLAFFTALCEAGFRSNFLSLDDLRMALTGADIGDLPEV